jgi:hypothetical protein
VDSAAWFSPVLRHRPNINLQRLSRLTLNEILCYMIRSDVENMRHVRDH